MYKNLISNGDFSFGDIGFNAERKKLFKLDVDVNPADFNSLAASYGDHTTGNGNMLIINGSVNRSAIVWEQTVDIVPNANYDFSLWTSTWFKDKPAQFELLINNEIIDDFSAPPSTGVWKEFTTTWKAGNDVSEAKIAVRNLKFAFVGNDFALDDIAFERLELGLPSNRDDVLLGTKGNDTIDGLGGDDVIDGGKGNDVLLGRNGKDTLIGGRGNDNLNGGKDDDILRGDQGRDKLDGERGDDTLFGGSSRDELIGGLGNDSLDGGGGGDWLYGGQGRDELTGGGGRDLLDGGTEDDLLNGGGGNDKLTGGLGNDLLTGGGGKDLFIFSAGSGRDVITDFEAGRDRIGLSGGLTFGSLRFKGSNIIVRDSRETLAKLDGFNATTLSEADFITV